jgi:DNA-binding response OmpR family regulator
LQELAAPVMCGLTHGRISGSAILMDVEGHYFLIDREQTAVGPIVLDDNALEMVIRLECMQGISLSHRLILEQTLLGNQMNGDIPREIIKPLNCINLIRRMAEVNPDEYLRGLLFTALGKILEFNPSIDYTPEELIMFLHSLLLVSMLIGQLSKKEKIPQQALESLWIDLESREVWVEGKQIDLTPQDLEILVFLYKNSGQQHSRQQIIDLALQNEPENIDISNSSQGDSTLTIEESRLNSAMSRLRKKIEPDPENPKYLHTIRGIGYRLDV